MPGLGEVELVCNLDCSIDCKHGDCINMETRDQNSSFLLRSFLPFMIMSSCPGLVQSAAPLKSRKQHGSDGEREAWGPALRYSKPSPSDR